jgi:hypothetical protein
VASDKICSVEGCGKPVKSIGLCNMHRLRMARRGTTDRDPNWIRGEKHCEKGKRTKVCPAAWRIRYELDYDIRPEYYAEKARLWGAAHKDRKKELQSTPEMREKARIRIRQWVKDNPEKSKASSIKFNAENKALVRSYKALRRARVRQASPPWTTKAIKDAMTAIFQDAEALTAATGEPHHVDHIVPLAGSVVCGLHLPQNLRPLPGVENNRRPRIPTLADLDAFAAWHMADLRGKGLAKWTID